jgi:3-oxoadipate enol-lactonase
MTPEKKFVKGPAGRIAYATYGEEGHPAVVMTHSILTAAMMWHEQATLLAGHGYYVLSADTRGHGQSDASEPPYLMEDLVEDVIALLDGLRIERAHYVGLSLGGMTGFGAGIDHGDRLLSLCLVAARADQPETLGAIWNERVTMAAEEGIAALATPTLERWFGKPFLESHPRIADAFRETISATSFRGFSGSARAIQKLNFLPEVHKIRAPSTMIVGTNDGPLPEEMKSLAGLIPGAKLELIEGAGHLPNIDHPEEFNAALLRHFQRVTRQ